MGRLDSDDARPELLHKKLTVPMSLSKGHATVVDGEEHSRILHVLEPGISVDARRHHKLRKAASVTVRKMKIDLSEVKALIFESNNRLIRNQTIV